MASYLSFAVSGFLQNGTREGFKDKGHIYLQSKQNVQLSKAVMYVPVIYSGCLHAQLTFLFKRIG